MEIKQDKAMSEQTKTTKESKFVLHITHSSPEQIIELESEAKSLTTFIGEKKKYKYRFAIRSISDFNCIVTVLEYGCRYKENKDRIYASLRRENKYFEKNSVCFRKNICIDSGKI
ncbi:MAG: hypothetical protein Dasosvirus1_19 [Dasosvirus sp.]|uniref:Uncharacterized protein n=1 Tax=Dasosvirus sp. TaxID=2487764 RepID=A0A3G4ZST8_9VIRU|nr:MAG: hypothetical protein Dasosvirus1_19 [Dasosvirus sp.]